MIRDPIVEEVHRVREQMWEECGGDLDLLIESFRASEVRHHDRIMSLERLEELRKKIDGRQNAKNQPHQFVLTRNDRIPLSRGCLEQLCCKVIGSLDVGDHRIYAGEMLRGALASAGRPYVHLRSDGLQY